ncbi:MAG: hypothetical protein RIR00_684 [Pseudomonadota bacterium]|jgi:DNA-binding PadR family transcriptional regulator
MIPELLQHPDPGQLVTTTSPEDIVRALRELEAEDAWPEWTLELLDRLFIVWAVTAIVRRGDEQGLAELQSTLDYACHRTRNRSALPETSRQRWLIVSDMLEARRQGLIGRDPDLILNRKHVRRLLSLLQAGETAQAELAAALVKQGVEVSDGRLSQLLSLMEGHGLLEKRKDGRENRVKLTDDGKRHTQEQTPQASPATPAKNGKGFMHLLRGDYEELELRKKAA